jgi:hypothetical protein
MSTPNSLQRKDRRAACAGGEVVGAVPSQPPHNYGPEAVADVAAATPTLFALMVLAAPVMTKWRQASASLVAQAAEQASHTPRDKLSS